MSRVAELTELPTNAPHLELALTHPSFAHERGDSQHNQRLEFLGDAVLEFCTSELLYRRFPSADEGTLTRLRARLVNTEALAKWARDSGLAPELRLGRGADSSGLRENSNVLADAVEALIAAAFLDAGLESARRLCEVIVERDLASADATGGRDPKSTLQERSQAAGLGTPRYEVVDGGGPDHARWFEVSVWIQAALAGRGRGRSKQAAEFAAAEEALLSETWRGQGEES
ncbi:MAG: ribonuclease III [Polyangiaceae bacterium]|nr:ribonuclease III [Polyangiaceae bacterium]